MTGRTWLFSSVWTMVALTTGCVTAGHEGDKLAREAGPSCEIPLEYRSQVYVFVVGGNNPIEYLAGEKFREGLNAHGFAKVASGPLPYTCWMASEIRRIHIEQPSAVFVIAGLESSVAAAIKLSEQVSAEGIPIPGVVIVDSTGKTPAAQINGRTLVVGPKTGAEVSTNSNRVAIASTGQLGLPAEPETIREVVALLNEIALGNPPPPKPMPSASWNYEFAPDVEFSLDYKLDSEWSFLFDQPGGMTSKIEESPEIRIEAVTAPAKRID